MFMNTDLILCMFIDFDQSSYCVPFCLTNTLFFSVKDHLIIMFNLKFAFIHINDYRHYTLHVYRPFYVTMTLTFRVQETKKEI